MSSFSNNFNRVGAN